MTPKEKLIEKIRALKAKSEDASCTEAEASAFAAKVQELMAEHDVDESDLKVKEDIQQLLWAPDYADPWRRSIATWLARFYSCVMINTEVEVKTTSRKTGKTIYVKRKAFIFVGRPHRVLLCQEMSQYLFNTVVRLCRQHSTSRSHQLQFARGCGERIADRLFKMCIDLERKAEDTSDSKAIVAVSEMDEAFTWVRENMKIGMSKFRGSNLDGDSAAAGAAAGDRVGLGPQITGAGSTKLLGG